MNTDETHSRANATSLLDFQRLEQLAEDGGVEPLSAVLFDIFKQDGVREMESLKSACAEENREKLVEHAHRLKGMCSNLGMRALKEQLSVVEAEARNENLPLSFSQIQNEIENLFRQTKDAYAAYLDEQ